MKLLLNPQLGFRGWIRMPRVLFDIKNNMSIKTLNQYEFDVLSQCDGEHDLEISDFIRDLLNENIVYVNNSNSKLKKEQKYKFFNNRHFNSVRWGLTGRCNYKCRHCFMAEGNENDNSELSREECLDIANQIADCGIEDVILTGGEPLLRADFFDIVDELIKRNVKINAINTNGSFITKEFIEEIKKRNIKPAFSVSFDGIGCHNWMRGVDRAEEEALNAIKILVEAGFYVIVVCCIHRGNIHVLKDTIDLMNRLGVNRVEIYRTQETLRWKLLQLENNSLSYKECYDIYLDLLYMHKKRNYNMEMYLMDFCYINNKSNVTQIVPVRCSNSTDFSKDFVCPNVRSMLFIAPNGQVLPCNAYTGYTLKNKLSFESLKDIKLKDILTNSNYLDCVLTTVKDLFDRNKECKSCEYSEKCMGGRCRLIALASTGDFYGKDESACAFFKGNYDFKIKEFMNSL